MKKELQHTRENYSKHELLENMVEEDAIEQFRKWFGEWEETGAADFNAMTLSTVGPDGQPSARVVLLKGVEEGGFEFYTNYRSHKGCDIETNPKVALSFYWPVLERQVRIEGVAEKLPEYRSAEYFEVRPEGSKIGAWASPQSSPISKDRLEQNVKDYEQRFGSDIPKPPHWGGYSVKPVKIEFWQGRSNRLHDRLLYTKAEKGWKIERLAP